MEWKDYEMCVEGVGVEFVGWRFVNDGGLKGDVDMGFYLC